MRIVVDPGHGGHDPGAVNLEAGAQEKDIALRIATALHTSLLWAGHASMMTRDGDRFLALSDRVALARAHRADAFVSIHCNAAVNRAARGLEVWTSPGQTRADDLAERIGEELLAAVLTVPLRKDVTDGDLDKEGRLYVLTMTPCPAVLIECGFVSNDDEARWLREEGTARELARAISLGICRGADKSKGGIGA
jgi:N-acetylmuramoyl-L-alanine amidase